MDASGFEALYREHYPQLRNAAWSMTGDKDAAHDLVQEVFVKLWTRLPELDAILNPRPYLLRAVMNASITYLEKSRRLSGLSPAEAGPDSSDKAMLLKDLEKHLQAALDHLPPKCKAIFILSRFEEKSYKEIAALLGLSVKTVENQMGIALKKLRKELQPFLTKDILALAMAGGLPYLLLITYLHVSYASGLI